MDVRPAAHTARAMWAPSRTRYLLRSRLVRASLILLAGFGLSLWLAAQAAQVEAAKAGWGQTRSVMVVTEPIAVGDPIAGAVAPQDVPEVVAPATAIDAVDGIGAVEGIGAVDGIDATSTARVAMYPGEIVLKDRITSSDSLVPPGHAAVTLSVQSNLALVEVGTLVDVWTIDSANQSSRRVIANVAVLDITDRDITVAVTHDMVAAVTAVSLRPVTVTLIS